MNEPWRVVFCVAIAVGIGMQVYCGIREVRRNAKSNDRWAAYHFAFALVLFGALLQIGGGQS